MGKEYLSTFKSLRAKEKARPFSQMKFKYKYQLIMRPFSMESGLEAFVSSKKAPRCSIDFQEINNYKLIHKKIVNPLKVCRTEGCLFSMIRMYLKSIPSKKGA